MLLTKNAPKSQTINVSSATVTAPMVTASHTQWRTPIHSTILGKTQFANVCVSFIRTKLQTFTVFKNDNKNLELNVSSDLIRGLSDGRERFRIDTTRPSPLPLSRVSLV